MESHSLDTEQMSVLISRFVEMSFSGTEGISVQCRRRLLCILERITNHPDNDVKLISSGSASEGITMAGSDEDGMHEDNHVVVLYPGENVPPEDAHKTVLYMRESDSRPGYVTLQLVHPGRLASKCFIHALVPVGNDIFVSSDMFREQFVNTLTTESGIPHVSNGPSSSIGEMADFVGCFHLKSWPKEANQWLTRPRLYGWPRQALVDEIVQNGCHLVPVGDKCSEDTLLQWRISFVSAEKLLIFSLSHIQMKIYYFLKYFLKQMKDTIQDIIGKEDDDILCSYHLKTLMFISVENSNPKLWQNHSFLYCFWFCFNILISCVRAGYFPNYFIPTNNLFQRKVHGQNQQKLFHILSRYHSEKLLCLSHSSKQLGNFNLLEFACNSEVQTELLRTQSVQENEYERDININCVLESHYLLNRGPKYIARSINVQSKCLSELDEVIGFAATVKQLSKTAMEEFHQDLTAGPTNNKTRYRTLRKCQHRLTLCASMGTHLLDLATLHFLTGNYVKARELCRHITSQPSYYTGGYKSLIPQKLKDMYIQKYCGKGYTSIYKLKKTFAHNIWLHGEFMHLPHLLPEITVNHVFGLLIPPLPYAVFLSFLCCHELKDRRGCDVALRHLIQVKYDELQGGHEHWIVHTLLGICYQTLGDYRRAIRAYRDSAQTKTEPDQSNPALERIAPLQRFAT